MEVGDWARKASKITPHRLTGVQKVHGTLRYFGKGIRIGIIDSGVDYTHPALGGCFGKGCKVAYGHDFVGDDGQSPDSDPASDCNDHGTHVAGIIAANDTYFLGVAPQATIGAYRIFNCKGKTGNDIVMKELLRAAQDRMQVINLSLGSPGGWRQAREARLLDRLSRNGTIIVAAAGNEGRSGMFEVVSPGVAGSAIQVASLENPYISAWYFIVRNESLLQGTKGRMHDGPIVRGSRVAGSDEGKDDSRNLFLPDESQSKGQHRKVLFKGDAAMPWRYPLVQVAPGVSGRVEKDACNSLKANFKGNIVLIRRGGCSFREKIANAVRAQAAGIIFMNNVDGPGFSADTKGSPIPACTISLSDGEYLLGAIRSQKKGTKERGGIRLAVGLDPQSFKNSKGGLLSVFTSPGPDAELNMKPDIVAPGGNIWSTVPVKMGSYGSKSGTSMTTPYIVGCVALYLEGFPNANHSAASIKSALQNFARPVLDGKDFNGYASIAEQGAGLVAMMSTLSSQTLVTPSHLSLNDSAHIHPFQTLTLSNNVNSSVSYTIDLVAAAGLIPFFRNNTVALSPARTQADAQIVDMPGRTIEVAPESSSKVEVVVRGPQTDPKDFTIYSGFIRFTPNDMQKAPVVTVPFLGMQGEYSRLPVMDKKFGLKVVDRNGRPLRSKAVSSANPRTQQIDIVHGNPNVNGIGNEDEDKDEDDDDSDDDVKPRSQVKVMYRLFTASRLLVLDLVSAEGSNPYKVQSYGLLNKGIARYIPRNDNREKNVFETMDWDRTILNKQGVPILWLGATARG